jgi:hypothetical protein
VEELVAFYEPHFASPDDAASFVLRCVSIPGAHPAKTIMYQTTRLVSLSEEVGRDHSSRDGLQLMFLMICAENISKLQADFHDDGESRKYARRFFSTFLQPDEIEVLRDGFLPWEPDEPVAPLALLSRPCRRRRAESLALPTSSASSRRPTPV